MAKKRRADPPATEAAAGFQGPPADTGLSIDRLAQAFAAMMGGADPYGAPAAPADVVREDASPDLDDADRSPEEDSGCRVSPLTILEALLFVGLADAAPISSRRVAALMRGVRSQEIDDMARQLQARYRADNCPYEIVSRSDGWLLRLRPEFARFGSVLEGRARQVRLDGDALDVLAAVAWNQPVPRDRLVDLGCDARPAVLRQLVRRGLLELKVPADGAGEPVYRTTPRFLEVFRLERIEDLPEPHAPPA